LRYALPTDRPTDGAVVSIRDAYEALLGIVGVRFADPGLTQERLRGEAIHRAACAALGFATYGDTGKFPDVLSQAIELKLQLARTVDLGLELPSSLTPIASLDGKLSASDVRYAIFYADRESPSSFIVTALVMASGAYFWEEFQQFGGRVSNSKLQLRLPTDFFFD
jgi:hypothetical protein